MLSLKAKRQLRRAASGRLTRPEALRKLKQWGAILTRFSRHRASAYCVLLNHNTKVFLNRKALSAKALRREKSSTLNAEILHFIKAADAGGLAPVKDGNAEKGQKIKFKAGSYISPLLKESPELAAECSEPETLHCHGCINSCRLGSARCELGRSILSALRGVQ